MAAAGRIGLSKLADSSRMCTHRRPWQLEAVAGLENGHAELCNPPSHVVESCSMISRRAFLCLHSGKRLRYPMSSLDMMPRSRPPFNSSVVSTYNWEPMHSHKVPQASCVIQFASLNVILN
jgi:hypothetical protein